MNNVQTGSADADKATLKRERMVAAARAIIADKGLRALKVRDVARSAGTSLGGVYLHFADLDALVVAVNRLTVARLDAVLREQADPVAYPDPRARIHAMAGAYLAFAVAETNLLRALFEHRMEDQRPFPDDLLDEVGAVFGRLATPLAVILEDRAPGEVAVVARTMFSAFHGIVTMGIEERIVAVPAARLREQVALFVDAFLLGLPGTRKDEHPVEALVLAEPSIDGGERGPEPRSAARSSSS